MITENPNKTNKKCKKINQYGRDALGKVRAKSWTIQQQTRAIHIVRAEPQKSQMIKRNHRFIFCKGSHTVVFGDLARRPLVAISSSDTLRNFGERQGDAFAFREWDCPHLSDTQIKMLERAYTKDRKYIRVSSTKFRTQK